MYSERSELFKESSLKKYDILQSILLYVFYVSINVLMYVSCYIFMELWWPKQQGKLKHQIKQCFLFNDFAELCRGRFSYFIISSQNKVIDVRRMSAEIRRNGGHKNISNNINKNNRSLNTIATANGITSITTITTRIV